MNNPRNFDAVLGGNKPGPEPGAAVLGGELGRQLRWQRKNFTEIFYYGDRLETPLLDKEAIDEVERSPLLPDYPIFKRLARRCRDDRNSFKRPQKLFWLHWFAVKSRVQRIVEISDYGSEKTFFTDEEAIAYLPKISGKFADSLWECHHSKGWKLSPKQLFWTHKLAMEYCCTEVAQILWEDLENNIPKLPLEKISELLYPPTFQPGGYPEIIINFENDRYLICRKTGNGAIYKINEDSENLIAELRFRRILATNICQITAVSSCRLDDMEKLNKMLNHFWLVEIERSQNPNKCFFCGGLLRTALSLKLGYGRTCAEKNNLPWV